ncbi:RIC1-domain-containing protein [Powellomyces hirtus]|nr:RIC1-domain-containing protein [Powellomyces hirtus]
MYFHAHASARILTAPTKDASLTDDGGPTIPGHPRQVLVAVKHCPAKPLFVAISENTIYLWSARPTVLLAVVERSKATIIEDGENIDIFWKPDGSTVVVATNKGHLHFYDVYEPQTSFYNLEFSAPHHYVTGPGEARGIPSQALRFRIALGLDAGIQCGTGLKNELLLSTIGSLSILSLSWHGEIILDGIVDLSQTDFYQNEEIGLREMVVSDGGTFHCWVSDSGRAYLAQRHVRPGKIRGAPESASTWTGSCFYNEDGDSAKATCIAINNTFSLIAVGTVTGGVVVFSLSEDGTELQYSHSCLLDHAGKGHAPVDVGAVSSLAWSRDGYALAVGWVSGGLSVWSVYGRILTSPLSEDGGMGEMNDKEEEGAELYRHGVRAVAWGMGDFELFVLPYAVGDKEPMTDIYVLPFAKSALAAGDVPDNKRSIVLVHDDKLTLYEGDAWDSDMANLGASHSVSIQIPVMYITQNWPIKYAISSATGSYLAIAGIRGLAHYSTLTNRWKLFGNEQQEQSFSVVGGMMWYRDLLIAGCHDHELDTHEIRFFSRESSLSTTHLVHREPLPRPLIALNIFDAHLLVYTGDNVMRHYVLSHEGRGMRVTLEQQISLDGVIVSPGSVRAVAWYPPTGSGTLHDIKQAPIVVLNRGELSILRQMADQEWEMVGLADSIECLWVSRPQDRAGTLANALWGYDAVSLKMWTNLNMTIDSTTTTATLGVWQPNPDLSEALRIEVDFYPLTVMLHKGVIAGVDEQLVNLASSDFCLYRINVKNLLFLHTLIRHILTNGTVPEAVAFARAFSHLPYFDHALEVLLHTVLEAEAHSQPTTTSPPTPTTTTATLLATTTHLLSHFASYPDIVVQCARKTEAAHWPFFFATAGDPKILFRHSLDRGALRTATSCLIIVQSLEDDVAVSAALSIDLLERAEQLEDYETRKEVTRFLTSIQGQDGDHYRRIIADYELQLLQVQGGGGGGAARAAVGGAVQTR